MEEITSFQSSTSFLTEPTPSLLQQRLQYIVESCQEWWVYAIFWQASKDDHHHLLLSFADSFVNRSHHQSLDQGINTNHGIFRGSELIMLSFLRSFVPGDDLIGRTFGSGSYLWLAGDHAFQLESSRRAKEAHLHGIKTLVCIATSWGVAEFGSSHVLKEDWDLVQLAKSLFTSETNQVQQFARLCIGAQNGISGETKEEGRMEMNISPTRADILKKRGRKAKNTTTDDQVNPKYIDMERQRREKLNQRFYALRSVVPYVSKMDKASLLADAVTYISELNSKIETLTQKAESLQKNMEDGSPLSTKYMIHESEVEVRILGSEAMIRVQSPDVNHPAARLMDAMRKLEIRVHHASVSNISDLVIQDVIAHIPKGYTMNDEEALRASIQNYL